jgi:hypothetical protein
MSIWSGLVGPGVVAAAVTLAFNWWIQRPRTDLRMIRSGFTVTDLERLKRAKEKASDTALQWQPWHVVRLTNYGDGTGYDIKLTGTNCRPRVWVDDGGIEVPMPTYAPPPPPPDNAPPPQPETIPTKKWPMWSDTISALVPGELVHDSGRGVSGRCVRLEEGIDEPGAKRPDERSVLTRTVAGRPPQVAACRDVRGSADDRR